MLNDLSAHSLADLSISRPTARCSWGIPVPGDPSQMVDPITIVTGVKIAREGTNSTKKF